MLVLANVTDADLTAVTKAMDEASDDDFVCLDLPSLLVLILASSGGKSSTAGYSGLGLCPFAGFLLRRLNVLTHLLKGVAFGSVSSSSNLGAGNSSVGSSGVSRMLELELKKSWWSSVGDCSSSKGEFGSSWNVGTGEGHFSVGLST